MSSNHLLVVTESSVLLEKDVVLFESVNTEGQWVWSVGSIVNVSANANTNKGGADICTVSNNDSTSCNRIEDLQCSPNTVFAIREWKLLHTNNNSNKHVPHLHVEERAWCNNEFTQYENQQQEEHTPAALLTSNNNIINHNNTSTCSDKCANVFRRSWNELHVLKNNNNFSTCNANLQTKPRASLTSMSSEPMALSSSASSSTELQTSSSSASSLSSSSSSSLKFSSSAPRQWLFAKETANYWSHTPVHNVTPNEEFSLSNVESDEWKNLLCLPFSSVPEVTRRIVSSVLYTIDVLDLTTVMNAIYTQDSWQEATQCIRKSDFPQTFQSFAAYAAAEGGLDVHINASTLQKIKCRLANVKDVLLRDSCVTYENAYVASALTAHLYAWLRKQFKYYDELVKRRSDIVHTHKQFPKFHVHHAENDKSTSFSSSSSAIFTTRATSPLPEAKTNSTKVLQDSPTSQICTSEERLHEELWLQEQHGEQCTSLTFVYNDADLSESYINREAIFCRVNVSAMTSVLKGVLTLDAADLLWLYELTLSRQGNLVQDNTYYVKEEKEKKEVEEEDSCASPLPLPLHQIGKSSMPSANTFTSSSTFRISTPLKVETVNKTPRTNTSSSEDNHKESYGIAISRSIKMYTKPAECDNNDIVGGENACSAEFDVEATKPCSLTNTATETETTTTTTNLLENVMEEDGSEKETSEWLNKSTKSNMKKEHGLMSRIFGLSTRWISQFNESDVDPANTFNMDNNCNTNHNVNCNTITLYRKDGLPNIRAVAFVMEMLYDEYTERTEIELTETNTRLATYQEYNIALHKEVSKEVNALICNHNASYARELTRHAIERVQLLESALRNSLVSSCMTTYVHLHQLKSDEGRDVLLMSTAHEYADKLEEARFQIRAKHSRHLRAVDELQQAQIKCLALIPSLSIKSAEDQHNTDYEHIEYVKANRYSHYYEQEKNEYPEELEQMEKPKSNAALCALNELLESIDNAIDLLTDDGCQTNEPTVTPLPLSLKQALYDRFATVRCEKKNYTQNIGKESKYALNHNISININPSLMCLESKKVIDSKVCVKDADNKEPCQTVTIVYSPHKVNVIRTDNDECIIWKPQSELDRLKAEVQKMQQHNTFTKQSAYAEKPHHYTSAHL